MVLFGSFQTFELLSVIRGNVFNIELLSNRRRWEGESREYLILPKGVGGCEILSVPPCISVHVSILRRQTEDHRDR